MAIPKFLSDLNIIAKLGDYPGSDDNLSTDQFKAKFDEAPLLIQKYINDVLIPNLDQLVDVQALINAILDSTLTEPGKAADAKAVGDIIRKLQERLRRVEDSTPTFVRTIVHLPVSGWSGNIQTVAVAEVTPGARILVSPDPTGTGYQAYLENGVRCTGQGDGSLTFQCECTPDIDLSVNIEISK